MQIALNEAKEAAKAGEVPIGAIIIHNHKIIAKAQNRTLRDGDPTAHAEILAIRKASQILQNHRLNDCTLFVTLEPCAMCAGAIAEARIAALYYGAEDKKSGGTAHGAMVFSHKTCHHKPQIYDGLYEESAKALLQEFFQARRKS